MSQDPREAASVVGEERGHGNPRSAGGNPLKDGEIAVVMTATEGSEAVSDIRSTALSERIPDFTTAAGTHAAALAMRAREVGEVGVRKLAGVTLDRNDL